MRRSSAALAAAVLTAVLAGCGSSSHVRLTVEPHRPLIDRTVHIRVEGLRAGETVTYPGLVAATVALAPSADVTGGLGLRVGQPAWTLVGRPVPTGPIAVERIRGPILLAAGAADALWPSWLSANRIVDRLAAHGRHAVTFLQYPGAGHAIAFAIPNVPLRTTIQSRYGTLYLGGSVPADARARADLWPKLLRFLAR